MLQSMLFLLRCFNLQRVPHQSPERVAHLQQRRLRRLVAHAIAQSPFYRRLYRHVDLDRLQLTDLPPTSKSTLMANFEDVIVDSSVQRAAVERFVQDPANRGTLFNGKYAVSHTSGSQGQPFLLVHDPFVVDLLFALQVTRGNNTGRITPAEVARRLLSKKRLATIGMEPGFFPSSAAFAHFPDALKPFVQLQAFSVNDPQYIEKLNAYNPHVLIAYASILNNLALKGEELHLPELRQVVNNSETLTEQARTRVETAFDAPVLDNYATGECLFLTNGCPEGPGAHVNADWAILEVVDEDYRPVPVGQLGKKVLVTNLANRVQPLIRYEVGDMVAMTDQPCRCGSRLPKVAQIKGRTADEFWFEVAGQPKVAGGLLFKNALDPLWEIHEWQAVQDERNHVSLRLQLLPGARPLRETLDRNIVNRLHANGLPADVDVDVSYVPVLEPDAKSHKLQRIVSKVGKLSERLLRQRETTAGAK